MSLSTAIGESRTIKVHGHLKEDGQNNFIPGMFVEANVVTDLKTAESLPSEAVLNIDGADYILVLVRQFGIRTCSGRSR